MLTSKLLKPLSMHYRSKLRHMLQISNLYRVQLLLGKMKETEMHAECAILYGKVTTFPELFQIS